MYDSRGQKIHIREYDDTRDTFLKFRQLDGILLLSSNFGLTFNELTITANNQDAQDHYYNETTDRRGSK